VGGAALAGFHTAHRGTRDVDLFWAGEAIPVEDAELVRRLEAAGFDVHVVQRAPAFRRLRAERGGAVVVVDLVADAAPVVENATEQQLDEDVRILVDPPHEILVSKLCALLSRSELRDLEDVRALLHSGEDLVRALADAPRKDAGFSPITFAWVLKDLPVDALGRALGRKEEERRALEAFRGELVDRVLAAAKPM
jgi:hypothetical protein